MRLGQHVFEIGEQQGMVESVLGRGGGKQLLVGLGDADDFDFRAVAILLQKSVNVAVHKANNADAEKSVALRLGVLGEENRRYENKEKPVKHFDLSIRLT
jgi:hypothetical protein